MSQYRLRYPSCLQQKHSKFAANSNKVLAASTSRAVQPLCQCQQFCYSNSLACVDTFQALRILLTTVLPKGGDGGGKDAKLVEHIHTCVSR